MRIPALPLLHSLTIIRPGNR